MNIPAKFQEVIREEYTTETLIVTHWMKCLKVFPVPIWEETEEKLVSRLEDGNLDPKFGRLIRYLMAGVNECQLDKQGRILVPQTLRQFAGLEKDVVLTGNLNRIEVWSKEKWSENCNYDDMDSIAESMQNIGIVI